MEVDLLSDILHALKHAGMISLFVFVMMLLVDYFNVLTKGRLTTAMRGGGWRQYPISSFLGATPGCLGSFLNVSFYVHGLLTFGAIVGGMIATSGDEAFVMLSLFPDKALILFGCLFILGVFFAWLTDIIAPLFKIKPCRECDLQQVHSLDVLDRIVKASMVNNLLRISLLRAVLIFSGLLFLMALVLGLVGPETWGWERITFITIVSLGIAIIGSVPEHYLKDHIWHHIVKRHLWRVFLWSFFAITIVHLGLEYWNLEAFVKTHMVWVLFISVLIGVIPESGPHLIFVMLFAQGHLPFSVLLASSMVQDGHGMLPLLSYSLKDSILIKIFNLIYGLLIGGILYTVGL